MRGGVLYGILVPFLLLFMTLDSIVQFFVRLIQRVREFVLRKKITSAAIAVVVLFVLGSVVANGTREPLETVRVTYKPFIQQVSVSGKVQASSDVAMAFEQTGRVDRIYVSVGDMVRAGDPLVSISAGTLAAQLQAAQAQVTLKRVERDNSSVNLDEVRRQQDTEVASAFRTLLSEDLEATPFSSTYTVSPPVVTGAYKGNVEGYYKVSVSRRISGTTLEMRVHGIEDFGPIEISKTGPTAVGTQGLFMSFPDTLASYDGTIWYVYLPNTKSTSYVANYNAYQEALRARDKAIADAEATLQKRSQGLTIKDAELAAAEAEVARILAELAKYSLRAPFDGVVTAVDAKLGEAASLSGNAVSLISGDGLEIESFVPEINIAYLSVGDSAVVTLDAYGEAVPFLATVVAIDPAETVRDGVSTYRVRLSFATPDERIKSGMTANILITTDERSSVISVPQGILVKKDDLTYVPVQEGNKKVLRQVQTGLVSSLGEVEITSGLVEGDIVILSGS